MPLHSPRLQRNLSKIVRALWFVPAVTALGGIALGFLMPWVDAVPALDDARSGWLRTIVDSAPASAQQLLATSAGALATILGVAFSLTLVTLQLAAAQYTTRLLGRLLEDGVTKAVLGSYLGTVAYLLLVLRSVHGVGDAARPFVPRLSITLGLLFILGCLGLLAYFVHHLGQSIQAAHLVARVGKRTIARIEALERGDRDGGGEIVRVPAEPPAIVSADRSGYVQLVDVARLLRAAPPAIALLRVDVGAGDFLIRGTPVFSVWGTRSLSPEEESALRQAVAVGSVRSDDQDALFGIRQLADIALKALSPGLNDETTAIAVVNELGAVIAAAAGADWATSGWKTDRRRGVTVLSPSLSMRRLVEDGFGGIVRFGAGHPRLLARIVEIVSEVATLRPPPAGRDALLEIGEWVEASAAWDDFAPHEARQVRSRLERLRAWRERDPGTRPEAVH